MGTIVLVVATLVEIALAAYCIATQSNHRRVRSFVRIGALAAFVAFTLASVLQWGLRWYLLAALLLVWSAVAAWSLIRRKRDAGTFRTSRIAVKGVAALAAFAIAVFPAFVFPQYELPKPTGKLEVATVSYTYTDESRVETFASTGEKRKVGVQFWYPKDESGKYPLVVFSHGGLGTKTSNTSTFVDLASNGYVVASIDHPYHSLLASVDGKTVIIDRPYMQEFMNVNAGAYDDATEVKIFQKWMALRTADVGFVLDTILGKAKATNAEPVYGLIDTSKIGLFGHSMGGAAVVQVGRERKDVAAVINLDGDLLGEYQGYANGRVVLNDAPYPTPILSIWSDDLTDLYSRVTDPSVVPWKRVMSTAPKAYETHITNTSHLSLTDVPLVMPILVPLIGDPKGLGNGRDADPHRAIEIMNARVLEFFDAFLKGQGTFSVAGTY